MEKKYVYKYPHPSLTADCVVFGYGNDGLRILLIERGLEPYKGCWALPGGFMLENETIEECASRELREETGLHIEYLEQFHTFSTVDRDIRKSDDEDDVRVVTVAFLALVKVQEVVGGDDATRAIWFSLANIPQLAFDHEKIYKMALKILRERIYFEPVGFDLLPHEFTMTELQHLYEEILDTKFDRRNFYKKIQSLQIVTLAKETPKIDSFSYCEMSIQSAISGMIDSCDSIEEAQIIESAQEQKKSSAGRTPFKYIFNRKKYDELKKDGGKLEF